VSDNGANLAARAKGAFARAASTAKGAVAGDGQSIFPEGVDVSATLNAVSLKEGGISPP
jgi:hypothetical protein